MTAQLRYRVNGADELLTLDELLGTTRGARAGYDGALLADLLWPTQAETLRAMEPGGSGGFGLRDGCIIDVECVEAPAQVYCWINESGHEYYLVYAMDERGVVLAQHLSSSPGWAQHDIGIGSDWKHDRYREAHPGGYELVWLEGDEAKTHPGIVAAMAKNQRLAAEASKASEATS